MSFAAELRVGADDVWEAQHAHPFVRGIGDATLPEERFRFYVRQDYRFLIEYGRLLALGAARAPRLAEMRRFAGLPDHPGYATWIATYADQEYQALAAWARELTDAAAADAGPGVRARMHAAFRTCSEHELAFWGAAWRS